ncbi:MAG: sodium:solute symporter family protein [Schwartzia sp.]|nr:sodium:solute symporter family protein [Schwartzia sp. (in: firmicutes)]
MDLSTAHIGFMLATVALVLGGGIYAARSVKSAEGYSLGGRAAGAPMVTGTIAGTVIGGSATVGTAQMAFSVGLSAWWFTLGSGIAFIVMGLFYAKRLRASGLTTIPELLVENYGAKAGVVTSVVASMGIFCSAVATTLPGIGILSAVLGISPYAAAGVLLALVVLYVFFGGMKSAGVGGILKMAVLLVSLVSAGLVAYGALPSGADFSATFPGDGWLSLFGNGVGNGLAHLASMIVGILCTQTYVQAIFSASNPRTAAMGAFLAALIVIPVGLPCVAVGLYMRAFEPDVSPLLVLPVYLAEHLPPWLGGVALGGVMLSIVGSLGGLALGVGTMIAKDILARAFSVEDEGKKLLLLRIVVLVVVVSACATAIAKMGTQVLILTYLSIALRGGGIFLPLTLAVFRPKSVAPRWALLSMVASTAVAVLFSTVLSAPVNPLFIGLAVSAVLLAPGLIASRKAD